MWFSQVAGLPAHGLCYPALLQCFPMSDKLLQAQTQALVEEFSSLATRIAQSSVWASDVDSEPGRLVMRSGVSSRNDLEVGVFADRRTALLCGEFLMALDRVFQPEFDTFVFVPEPSQSTLGASIPPVSD
mgnify:CR=1 FL=1